MSINTLTDVVKHEDNKYIVKMPWYTTVDFAKYFIMHGITAEYTCRKSLDNNYREIMFNDNAESAKIMLAWIETWHDGHKQCPFCASVGEVYTHDNSTHIRCTECGCMTRGRPDWYEDKYVWELWDKRI